MFFCIMGLWVYGLGGFNSIPAWYENLLFNESAANLGMLAKVSLVKAAKYVGSAK